MQSVTSILDGKAPVDGGTSLIAFLFERMDMSPQVSLIRDTLSQTTTAEHAQLDLGHVEPTAVYWSVVELQTLGDAPRFERLERIVERTELVGIEIVQHHSDRLSAGVCLVDQPLHLMSEVYGSAALGHLDVPPSALRFNGRPVQNMNRLRVPLRMYSVS